MKSITESTMLLVVLVPFQNTVATIASPRCGLVVAHGLQSKPLASVLPVSPRVPLILSSVMPPADGGGGGGGGGGEPLDGMSTRSVASHVLAELKCQIHCGWSIVALAGSAYLIS